MKGILSPMKLRGWRRLPPSLPAIREGERKCDPGEAGGAETVTEVREKWRASEGGGMTAQFALLEERNTLVVPCACQPPARNQPAHC